MFQNHLNQGHRWCGNCNQMVRAGAGGCGTCRSPLASLVMFDEFAGGGGFDNWGGGELGFDPMDGQFAVDMGDGLAYEPGTGDIDVETPFGDFPI